MAAYVDFAGKSSLVALMCWRILRRPESTGSLDRRTRHDCVLEPAAERSAPRGDVTFGFIWSLSLSLVTGEAGAPVTRAIIICASNCCLVANRDSFRQISRKSVKANPLHLVAAFANWSRGCAAATPEW